MERLNFFSHEKISENLYIVTEGYSMVHRFTIGVIVGRNKILIIDSGMGLGGDIREYIESFVGKEKPMICVCTHCHADHVGGAGFFSEVYCSRLDVEDEKIHAYTFDFSQRLADAEEFALGNPEVMEAISQYAKEPADCNFLDVKDGDVFRLGGIEIEAISIPGHTPGSMVYWNRADGYAFTGDSINTDVHLETLDREGLLRYRDAVKQFLKKVGPEVTIYPAHLPLPMTAQVAENLVRSCDELLNGKNTDDPPAESLFPDRKNRKNIRIHYVHNAGVAYDAQKLGLPFSFKHLCFYSYEQYSQRLFLITENYSWVHRFTIGVLVGDQAVAVIDSGLAMDDELRLYIEHMIGEKNSRKPMINLCTHGAIDHAGGASLFDQAYVNDRDIPMLPRVCKDEIRVSDLGAFALDNREVVDYGHIHKLDNHGAKFENVDEEIWFSLGGITIKPIRTPGHTMGHLCYYCPEEKVVFCGDCINADVHVKRLNQNDMRYCGKWIQRLLSIVPQDVLLFSGHLNRPHRISVAQNIAEACFEVADGKTAGDPPGEAIFPDQNRKRNMRMHYTGNDCVVYNNACDCTPVFPEMRAYPEKPEKMISF